MLHFYSTLLVQHEFKKWKLSLFLVFNLPAFCSNGITDFPRNAGIFSLPSLKWFCQYSLLCVLCIKTVRQDYIFSTHLKVWKKYEIYPCGAYGIYHQVQRQVLLMTVSGHGRRIKFLFQEMIQYVQICTVCTICT